MIFPKLRPFIFPLLLKGLVFPVVVLLSLCRRVKNVFCRPVIANGIPSVDIFSPSLVLTSDGEESLMEDDDMHETDESFETWFRRICEAVRQNDPSIDELELDCKDDSVCMNENDMKTLADAMQDNQFVTGLILQNMTINERAAEHLKRLIRQTNSIISLTLEEVEGEGCMAVARALTLNPGSSVRLLTLRGNVIDYSTSQALGLMAKSNRHILELRLQHNRIDAEAVSNLSLGLMVNRGLRVLDLMGNGLDDTSISKISNSLVYHDQLEYLCLDFNNFGVRGTQAIASMLRRNRRIQELHLFANRINSEGCRALADSLLFNESLKTLILSYNNIGDVGAKALGEALTVNSTLTKLWFSSNGIGTRGLIDFGASLPLMKGLEHLKVGDVFDMDAAAALLQGLKRNTRLSVLQLQSPICESCGICSVEEKLNFFLRMNKSGRSILHSSDATPSSLWSLALENANKNQHETGAPDVLYYMLRQKPDLIGSL